MKIQLTIQILLLSSKDRKKIYAWVFVFHTPPPLSLTFRITVKPLHIIFLGGGGVLKKLRILENDKCGGRHNLNRICSGTTEIEG
jgi:hypothetical protein